MKILYMLLLYPLSVQSNIKMQDDFDFLQCIKSHGWRQLAPFSWEEETHILSRVEDIGSGDPFLLKVYAAGDQLSVEYPDEVATELIHDRIRKMLQLDLEISAFHQFCASDPLLTGVKTSKQGRVLRSATLFEDVIKIIATTNTTWLQTKGMVGRLVASFGASLADGSGNAFPTAERIASTSFDEFNALVKLGYRGKAVHQIAVDIAEGGLDLSKLEDQSINSSDLYRALLTLPGIGPYAASSLMLYLGRYDRVNVDSWARALVSRELGRKVIDKEVHAFFEPYGKWKALVYHFYPWQESPPAY